MSLENFVKSFEKSFVKNWELLALSNYQADNVTYGELAERVLKLHCLFDLCIKKGDKIALIGKSSINWAVTYLAVVTYQATVVPILVDFHPNDITNIINHSDSVLLFLGEQILNKLELDEMPNLKGVIKIDDFTVETEKIAATFKFASNDFKEKYPNGIVKDKFKLPEVSNSHVGVISYTSGTTGFSKGVMLSLDSLMANINYACNNMPLKSQDKLLSILPLAHSYGCAFEFLWPITIGVHITFLGRVVSPQMMVEAFQEIKPRLIMMVPLILEKIYKKRLQPVLKKSSMKILLKIPIVNRLIYSKMRKGLREVFGGNYREVVIGGSALNKDVERFLRKVKFNFSVGYGMTECGPLISYASWNKAKVGSCGKLVDTLELTIDSPDHNNVPGEILVRGANVMTAYYKNSEATAKAIDKDGWLHTGDLGVVDDNNFIFIRGRSKSMILGASGENIYPEEIEAKLSNLPFVQEQIVVEEENKIVALVYPDVESVNKNGVQESELIEVMEGNRKQLNDNLPKYAQVAEIRIQNEEFAKTPKQSIKRFLYEN